MTEHQFTKLETEIALAAPGTGGHRSSGWSLIHVINLELKAELQQGGEPRQQARRGKAR